FVLGTEAPAVESSVWSTAGTEPGSLSRAAGLTTSGSLTAWLRELVGGPDFGTLVAEAAATAPGAEGLLVLPYFAGEPRDPQARGAITGLSLRHTRGHLYRAALEGIAYGARRTLETLADEQPHRVVAVGGGTRGGLWTQIVSDVTGLEQELPAQTLGAAYGDALLAAEGVGLMPPGSSWSKAAGVVSPRPEHRTLYDERYLLWRDLHTSTVAIQHQLDAY
ncbi:MAG TPA: FGGY-family carbohydrate kinase, partial [Solirubrobacterales bacterium]|nr:FGGY-family carbohydrate kinase [Solirubrobacterales bacterium]